jgi:hypothetical protein
MANEVWFVNDGGNDALGTSDMQGRWLRVFSLTGKETINKKIINWIVSFNPN